MVLVVVSSRGGGIGISKFWIPPAFLFCYGLYIYMEYHYLKVISLSTRTIPTGKLWIVAYAK